MSETRNEEFESEMIPVTPVTIPDGPVGAARAMRRLWPSALAVIVGPLLMVQGFGVWRGLGGALLGLLGIAVLLAGAAWAVRCRTCRG